MNMPNNDDNAWKVFSRDNEAGRLLSRLYGVPPKDVPISYPKIRTRRRNSESVGGITSSSSSSSTSTSTNDNNDNSGWKTTYRVPGLTKQEEEEQERQRKIHRERASSFVVPKVGRGKKEGAYNNNNNNGNGGDTDHINYDEFHIIPSANNNKVDSIPRRKNVVQCNSTIREYNFTNGKYRPPHARVVSSDAEKQRLNDVFCEKGGRCLPEEMTQPPASKGCSKHNNKNSSNRDKTKSSQPNTLFDQIYHEILERREHQLAMEEMGAGAETRDSTAHEIRVRLEQLKKLDSERAIKVVQQLRSQGLF